MTGVQQKLPRLIVILALAVSLPVVTTWTPARPKTEARFAGKHRAEPGRSGAATPRAETQITFNRDIAPILFRSCATCHRPGEAGPFPLLTYADAKAHARQLAVVTRSRFMPPWLPEPSELKFADELRLSDSEIARIQAWVEQGAVEGDTADLPAKPQFVEGWQLGKPDVVVKATKAYALPAGGLDNYWNFVFRAPVDRTRWLKAMEIRPGDKRLVHHANVLVDRQQTGRRVDSLRRAGRHGTAVG